jgi:thiol:disulfide interchange protein DsbD
LDARPGRREIRASLTYQACDDRTCLPSQTEELRATIEVLPDAAGAVTGSGSSPAAPAPAGGVEGRIEESPPSSRWKASFSLSKETLAAGEEAVVEIRLAIEPGWHVYAPDSPKDAGAPMEVEPRGFELVGPLEGPPPAEAFDPNFKKRTRTFEGDVVLRQRVRVPSAGLPEGRPGIRLRAMACDARSCLPPSDFVAGFEVSAPRAPARSPGAGAQPPRPPVGSGEGAQASRPATVVDAPLGEFLAECVAWGAWSLLTPCVYPMVPITISFFSKRTGGGRRRTLRLAALYALGIVTTFTGLGVAVAALFGAAGLNVLATNFWMNLGLATLFVVLGLSLLGLFELRAPSWLVSKVDSARQEARGEVAGTILMGVTFSRSPPSPARCPSSACSSPARRPGT